MNLKTQPFFIKLIVLGVLMMIGFLIASGILLAFFPEMLNGTMTPASLKVNQALGQLFMFVLPPFVFAWLVSSGPKRYYNLHGKVEGMHVVYTVLLFILLIPLIGYTTQLNQQMVLPDFLKGMEDWMRAKEDALADVIDKIAMAKTIPALLVNLVIMAVIPAIGEELFFRGFVQKYMHAWVKNVHVTVWTTAFLFSAFHLQFYGFLPRFIMGIALGYIFVWTRNMWMPVLFHFINNAMATIAYYLYAGGKLENQPEDVGSIDNPWIILFVTGAVITMAIYFHKNRVKDPDWPKQMGKL